MSPSSIPAALTSDAERFRGLKKFKRIRSIFTEWHACVALHSFLITLHVLLAIAWRWHLEHRLAVSEGSARTAFSIAVITFSQIIATVSIRDLPMVEPSIDIFLPVPDDHNHTRAAHSEAGTQT